MTEQPGQPKDTAATATASAPHCRRLWRRGLLLALALGVLGWLVLRSPDPLLAGDRALARAQDVVATAPPVALATGPLRAGWARRCITPDHPVGLFGYGERRGALSTGVADDLFARALLLDNGAARVLVFTADLLLIPDALADGVRREVCSFCAVPPEAVLFSATHTHGAPNPWDSWSASKLAGGRYDAAYGQALHRALIEAAQEALANLAPAGVASGVTGADRFAMNRVRKENPVDADIRFLRFTRGDGGCCFLVNVPAHGTVLGGKNRLVTGDWQGWVARHLEQVFGAFAMVQAGAVGSVRPVAPEPTEVDLLDVLDEARRHDPRVPAAVARTVPAAWHDFARACALGHAVAGMVVFEAADHAPDEQAALGYGSLAWDLPPPRVFLLPWRPLPPWLAAACGIDSETAFQALRIQDVVVEGIGGELSGELMLPLVAQARARGVELWVSSFSRDYKGYISPDVYYLGGPGGKGGYETKDMAWFGPRAGACFSVLIAGQLARFAPTPATEEPPQPDP